LNEVTVIEAEIVDEKTTEEINEQQKEEAVRRCYDWFELDRNAKSGIMKEFEELYKLYNGSHWDMLGPNGQPLRGEKQKQTKPNVVENVAWALIEGQVSEFVEDITLIDYPVEPGDDEIARIFTDLKEFIAYKNRVRNERRKWLRNFFLYGTAIWHVYWDPHWTGGKGPNRWVGDIRWKSIHPAAVFPDLRCKEDIHEGMRIHKAFYRTQEYVKSKYGVHVPADTVREDMLIGDEERSTGPLERGEEEVLLVETWYKGRPLVLDPDEEDLGEGMHVIWWAGDNNPVYLAHANYIYYDPGEDPVFPFIFRTRYPRENSVWGFGEGHYLKSPQIVFNKINELILEGHMHYSLGQTFYEEGAVTPAQKEMIKNYGTLANMWFPVQNIDRIRKEYGRGVSASLFRESDRLQRSMETLIGRFDISQGRTPGSVTAFRALDLLAARAQVRLRSAEEDIITAHEDCGNYINNLITKFYTERRTYRILGDNIDRPEISTLGSGEQQKKSTPKYGIFQLEDVQKVYIYDTGDSMPLKEFQKEFYGGEGMIEGEHYEIYCPQFDVVSKVSTKMPSDRMFYMEVAKELYAAQLIDAEVFWYVMEYGKFPPYEELIQKEKEKKIQEQQMMMMQTGALEGASPGGVPHEKVPLPENIPPEKTPSEQEKNVNLVAQIEAILEKNPELRDRFLELPFDAQQQVVRRILENAPVV